ncbi:transmembrane protein [Cystoisospora suis]|uniref:Transmembrane protein n=1 Tax=Cystoisospora suis TaxID=483139 RepID=A0A2C6L793_9APIC|nr:transmembrane protein [Cystoisospora suis]
MLDPSPAFSSPPVSSPPSSPFFRDQEADWHRHYDTLLQAIDSLNHSSISPSSRGGGDSGVGASAEDIEIGRSACDAAEICLRQMEAEARTLPNAHALLPVVRRYQEEYERSRGIFSRLVQQWQHQQLLLPPSSSYRAGDHYSGEGRYDLSSASTTPGSGGGGGGGRRGFDSEGDGRDDFEDPVHAIYQAGGKLLGESNRLAVESEQVGLSVMGQLRSQRESILNSRTLAQKSYGEVQESRSLLMVMLRRSLLNKTLLAATIVFLSLAIVFVLIHRLLRFVKVVG